MIETPRGVVRRLRCPLEVMLVWGRRYAACPLSLRNLGETMAERGVFVDHSTLHRRSIKVLSALAAVFRRGKRPVGRGWRMNETCVKISGQWKHRYRAVARGGDIVDFLRRARRDHAAARAFFEPAIDLNGVPEKITIDTRGANTAAITSIQADRGVPIEMRQSRYMSNLVERDTAPSHASPGRCSASSPIAAPES